MDENNFEKDSFESNTYESNTFESGTYESNTYESNTYETNPATGNQTNKSDSKSGSKALEICALIFGILGIVCCFCYGLFGIIGLILSIVCFVTGKKSGLSITGLICSIIGIILTIVIFAITLTSPEFKEGFEKGFQAGMTGNTDAITEDIIADYEEDSEDVAVIDEDEDTEEDTEDSSTKIEAPAPVDGLSDVYADLDNRSFAINGKVYTLGVTTLQEMIDDGVPFDADDIANASNNLNGNSSSAGFKIVLGEYYNAQVYVGNFTSDNKSAAECPICEIYLPVDLEESNDILQFAFPLTLTEEELVANSGEPTDKDEYTSDDGDYQSNTYEYKIDSEQYYGDSGYRFEFTNGELKYVYIDLK